MKTYRELLNEVGNRPLKWKWDVDAKGKIHKALFIVDENLEYTVIIVKLKGRANLLHTVDDESDSQEGNNWEITFYQEQSTNFGGKVFNKLFLCDGTIDPLHFIL